MGWAAAIGAVANVAGGVLSNRSAKKQAQRAQASGQEAARQVETFQNTGVRANEVLGGALGLGGKEASDAAFQNFLNSTGFQQQVRAGERALSGSRAASGILDSGSTAVRIQELGQDLAREQFNNFLGNLGGLSAQGLNAGQFAGQALGGGLQRANAAQAQGSAGFQSGLGQAFQGAANSNFFGLLGGSGGDDIPALSDIQVKANPSRDPIRL